MCHECNGCSIYNRTLFMHVHVYAHPRVYLLDDLCTPLITSACDYSHSHIHIFTVYFIHTSFIIEPLLLLLSFSHLILPPIVTPNYAVKTVAFASIIMLSCININADNCYVIKLSHCHSHCHGFNF